MTLDELKFNLKLILAEEDSVDVDWSKVESLCLDVLRRLNTQPEPEYPHDIVSHFLDDPDVRQKSSEYALMQRQRLRNWLAE
jgi:hypothetical protein